jgi:hypothetical protein
LGWQSPVPGVQLWQQLEVPGETNGPHVPPSGTGTPPSRTGTQVAVVTSQVVPASQVPQPWLPPQPPLEGAQTCSTFPLKERVGVQVCPGGQSISAKQSTPQ